MKVKGQDKQRYLKTGEAAELLGVTQPTIRAAVRRGELPGIRLGNQFLVDRLGLAQLADRAVTEPQPAQ